MRPVWSDRTFWRRVGLVAAGVWIATIVGISANSRSFDLFREGWSLYRSIWVIEGLGPAFYVVVAGLAAIIAICVGIPWIASALIRRPDRDNPQGPLP